MHAGTICSSYYRWKTEIGRLLPTYVGHARPLQPLIVQIKRHILRVKRLKLFRKVLEVNLSLFVYEVVQSNCCTGENSSNYFTKWHIWYRTKQTNLYIHLPQNFIFTLLVLFTACTFQLFYPTSSKGLSPFSFRKVAPNISISYLAFQVLWAVQPFSTFMSMIFPKKLILITSYLPTALPSIKTQTHRKLLSKHSKLT